MSKVFDVEEPGDQPIPFTVMVIVKDQPIGSPTRKKAGEFLAKPDLSMGELLVTMTAQGASMQSTMDFYADALVEENSHPEQPRPDDNPDNDPDVVPRNEWSEYERFADFIGDPNHYIGQATLNKLAEWLTEKSDDAERPTERSSGSRATRRSAQRGSTGKRPKRS